MKRAIDVSRRRVVLTCAATGAALAMRARAGAQKPPRVIAIGGALTEIVFCLGAQRWLIAADTTSTYPPPARQLPKVGYQRSLSAEGLLAMQPTLLLLTADAGPPAALELLRAAGVRTWRANGEHAFGALTENVEQVATALGMPGDGANLVRGLRAEWNATRATIRSAANPPRVLFVLSHAANNVQVAGEGTAADAMIRLSGAVNALQGFKGYRPMSSEAAIAAAPDYILATAEGIEALGSIEALLARPGLALTPAGRARRVIAPDALYLLGFGPRLPQAVRDVARDVGTIT